MYKIDSARVAPIHSINYLHVFVCLLYVCPCLMYKENWYWYLHHPRQSVVPIREVDYVFILPRLGV
jgi:hypothetical protein